MPSFYYKYVYLGEEGMDLCGGRVSIFAPTLVGHRRPIWPGHGDFTALAVTQVAPSISQPSGV